MDANTCFLRQYESEQDGLANVATIEAATIQSISDRLPTEMRGSLLLEAVSEIAPGNDLDDRIVAAYAAGDHFLVGILITELLNSYRHHLALFQAGQIDHHQAAQDAEEDARANARELMRG
jgi:hypothetical protein